MPDTPIPTDDLDERIRELVARAVADTPAAPTIDTTNVTLVDPQRGGRGWWIGGGAAALAAASLVGVLVLTDDREDTITTPNTRPTVDTVAPPTAPDSAPATVPSETSAPGTAAPPTSEVVELLGLDVNSQVVTAGPSGVTVRNAAGDVLRTLDEPMSIALAVGDGSVIMQRASGRQAGLPGEGADTAPLIWNEDGTLEELWPGADLAGDVTLHDLAIVDGEPLLLYSVVTGTTPDDSSEVLFTAPPLIGGGVSETVGEIGGWESGTSRLHLGADGLIVGEQYAEASRSPLIVALDGSAADEMVINLADLGLDEAYFDCSDCPRLYSVAPDVPELVWLDGNDLVKVLLSEDGPSEPQRIALPLDATTAGDLEVVAGGSVIVSTADAAQPPVWFQPGSEPTTLEGATATKSPDVIDTGSTSQEPPGPTTATPDSAPTTPAALASFVTAGSNGVTVYDGAGEVVRTLNQPAEIALLTPGGAVIFQPAPADPDAQPGDPLLWKTDGSVERLLGEVGERQSYRLHDVAEIDGVPTVLYGAETQGVVTTVPPYEADTAGFTEVLHALRMDPAGWVDTEIDEINTWEEGWERLSLSEQGLIVGGYGYSVTNELYINAVPGSPAADTTIDATTLGVEPSYTECQTCPGEFTVTNGGSAIAWMDGQTMVLHDLASGEQRRISSDAVGHLIDGSTISDFDIAILDGGAAIATLSLSGTVDDPELLTSTLVTISPVGAAEIVVLDGSFVTLGPLG